MSRYGSKKNKSDIIRLINSPLYEQYKNEISAISLSEYHNVFYTDSKDIIKHINITSRDDVSNDIYLQLMAIQEKYKISYTLISWVYNKDIFDKITINKYIYKLKLHIAINILTLQNDICFIHNNNIKHLEIQSIDNEIIDDIILNIKIKSLSIAVVYLDNFYKIINALHNSQLSKLDISQIKNNIIGNLIPGLPRTQEFINITKSIVNALALSIPLKKFILPLNVIAIDSIIDALSEAYIVCPRCSSVSYYVRYQML